MPHKHKEVMQDSCKVQKMVQLHHVAQKKGNTMDLGDRMKQYERAYKVVLPERLPVIIRIDGKTFHTVTKGFKRPFDPNMIELMHATACRLCDEIQNTAMAYVYSDEISLLLINYNNLDTSSWFGNTLQKMASVSAGIATYQFNKSLDNRGIAVHTLVTFDSRAFILPKEEVANYFIWRQQDATRNSIQSIAQANFSHRELQNLSCKDLKQKLLEDKDIVWENCPTVYKRGTAIKKEVSDSVTQFSTWVPDLETPIFTQNRGYIEDMVFT